MVWGCALAALAAAAQPAGAAWNNVFQVCCSHCGHGSAPAVTAFAAPTVAFAAPSGPGCCPPPCPPTCTTRYVQRCFYQPVTTFRTTTFFEPVTTYRTSFYYEPVTTCHVSCFFDPCTCSFKQVSQPVTSFQLRSRCCPVTSYLQRTACTPVTTYRQSFYFEPVTTCCSTTTGAPVAAVPAAPSAAVAVPAPAAAAPAVPAVPAPPPGTAETREPAAALPPPPPGTAETREPGAPSSSGSHKIDRSPGVTPPRVMPEAYRSAPPAVRLDRIASRAGGKLQGRVVDAGRSPKAGARVLFVSVEGKSIQHTATADAQGAFQARLAAGGWLVYTYDGRGQPVFSRRVDVPADRAVSMTLVNR
jgi:hypothetical protein